MDGKRGALTFALAYGRYHAAVQLHELLTDRQSQPEATKYSRGRGIFLRESVKDVRKIIGWNPNACVTEAQFQMRITALQQHMYLPSFWRELASVRHQVPSDLLQAGTLSADDVPA